jgi:hypothetical protein
VVLDHLIVVNLHKFCIFTFVGDSQGPDACNKHQHLVLLYHPLLGEQVAGLPRGFVEGISVGAELVTGEVGQEVAPILVKNGILAEDGVVFNVQGPGLTPPNVWRQSILEYPRLLCLGLFIKLLQGVLSLLLFLC